MSDPNAMNIESLTTALALIDGAVSKNRQAMVDVLETPTADELRVLAATLADMHADFLDTVGSTLTPPVPGPTVWASVRRHITEQIDNRPPPERENT